MTLRRINLRKVGSTFIFCLAVIAFLGLRLKPMEWAKVDQSKISVHDRGMTPMLTPREKMEQTVRHVQQHCKSHPINQTRFSSKDQCFLKSIETNRLLYCPVPKGGWSTWKRLLYRDAGVEHVMNDRRTGCDSEWDRAGLRRVGEDLSNISASVGHRLVFVRNPYDRLVSAYVDKALRNHGMYVKNQRRPCREVNASVAAPTLTFGQFVDCIVSRVEGEHRQLEDFQAGTTLDIHWRPQTLLCHFCQVDYTIIGKMETMSEDLLLASSAIGMKNASVVHDNKSDRSSLESSTQHWLNQLTGKQLRSIQQLYNYDFNILGYDMTTPT